MQITPIGYLRSPYKQKFAIPRQPNLVPQAVGKIEFVPEFSDANMLRGLETFSHLWLIFGFHGTADEGWSATVTPPRLGGNTRVGVFATRSTYRPNALGLSVVEFAAISQQGSALSLTVKGIDLLDQTPIFDIKPYIPYADALPQANPGYAQQPPGTQLPVHFSEAAQTSLHSTSEHFPELRAFITNVLQQDPRPAQHVRQRSEREFAMFLYDFNIRWKMVDEVCLVLAIEAPDLTTKGRSPR